MLIFAIELQIDFIIFLSIMAIKDLINTKKCLFICNGGSCLRKNSDELTLAIRKKIQDEHLEDDYHTIRTKCMGRCEDAPVAMVSPDNLWLKKMDVKEVSQLLRAIQQNKIHLSSNFLYQMGEGCVNSDSVPTKYRKTS